LVSVPRLSKSPRAGQEALAKYLDGKGTDTLALSGFTSNSQFHRQTKILEGIGEIFLAGIKGDGDGGKLAFTEAWWLGGCVNLALEAAHIYLANAGLVAIG
jgi:hypothetical protein